ncbi:MAG: hypothetical protein NTV34_06265 [Proteobacteria bacterium]|nr:hypothetical protein [Pseudomonadota bacterium]
MKSLGDPTGVVTAANRVIPRTTIDLISYSAYDAEFAASSLGSLKVRLHKALNYIEGKLPYKNVKGYPKRVFIGEFGYPMQGTSEDDQASMVREFLAAAIEWNVPYALYWQFYNNELDDQGRQRGFWLVDDHNHKVKSYHLIKTYLGKMNHFLNTHTSQFGTYPTQEATNKQALDFLK